MENLLYPLWAIQQESCFWTKDLYEKVGGIDKNCRLAGDFHLWVKFAHCTDLYTVNSVLAGFRIHEGQLSGDKIVLPANGKMKDALKEMLIAISEILSDVNIFYYICYYYARMRDCIVIIAL